MPNVIPFPASRLPLGEPVELPALRAGLTRAAAEGFAEADLQAVMDQDRPLATYVLQLLGSPDLTDRRHGALGLSRMIGTLDGSPDTPSAA